MNASIQSVCRQCGSDHLTPAFTLDHENAWVFCGDGEGERGCGLLQRATVAADVTRAVAPLSSWTERYRLRDVVASALEMITTREGHVLDLGCGDGELLSNYPHWMTPVGVDERLEDTGRTDWGIGVSAPFPADATTAALKDAAPEGYDVITAVGALEHVQDPRAFLAAARDLLVRDGVLVVETPYAALALTRTLMSPFHATANAVFALRDLEYLASELGLRIIRGSMTERAGGSIRVFMVHESHRGQDYDPWLEQLARLWDEEQSLNLTGRGAYLAFAGRMRSAVREIATLRDAMIRCEEFAYILGECSRTLAVMGAAGFGYDVVAAHIGAAPRPGFPEVVTEEQARATPPDVLVAPTWRRREALEQWYEEIMAGMRLVFLEPELLVVDADNYAAELGRALAVTDGPGSVATLKAALAAMRGPSLRVVSKTG